MTSDFDLYSIALWGRESAIFTIFEIGRKHDYTHFQRIFIQLALTNAHNNIVKKTVLGLSQKREVESSESSKVHLSLKCCEVSHKYPKLQTLM